MAQARLCLQPKHIDSGCSSLARIPCQEGKEACHDVKYEQRLNQLAQIRRSRRLAPPFGSSFNPVGGARKQDIDRSFSRGRHDHQVDTAEGSGVHHRVECIPILLGTDPRDLYCRDRKRHAIVLVRKLPGQ